MQSVSEVRGKWKEEEVRMMERNQRTNLPLPVSPRRQRVDLILLSLLLSNPGANEPWNDAVPPTKVEAEPGGVGASVALLLLRMLVILLLLKMKFSW